MRRTASHKGSRGAILLLAVLTALTLLAVFGLGERSVQAHKPITSKYTYNEDVFPILRDQCGRCHVAGGAVPMSLLTYADARPWAESIREELTSERMPPSYVDPAGPEVKGGHAISAREIDTIVTWATGGTPEGTPDKRPAPAAPRAQWKEGTPDLSLIMEKAHEVSASIPEETADFSLPTNITETKWVRAADLSPGTPSMVRDAMISIEGGPVLAAWVSGEDPMAAPAGTAFRLPAGATIHLQIHYKKPWQEAQAAKSDRSTVGLYFTNAPAAGEIQTLMIAGSAGNPSSHTFGGAMAAGGRVVALRPSLDRVYRSLDVHAVAPSGVKVPMLLLRAPRPEWNRRYWLAQPVDLPPGSTIEVTIERPSADSGDGPSPARYPLEIALDYVAR